MYCVDCNKKIFFKRSTKRRCDECKRIFAIKRASEWNNKFKNERRTRDKRSGRDTYYSIIARCNNPNSKAYKYYGGRDIKCIISQKEFIKIYFSVNNCSICQCKLNDLNRNASDGRTVDRIDVDGNYEKDNIRIICRSCNISLSHKKLSRNQIEQIKKEYIKFSKTHGTVALAKKYNVSSDTIWRTINNNYR